MPIIPPSPPPVATPTSVAELAPSVLSRVQDPAATFWNLNLEVYSALVEAINDLMLIVGRPRRRYRGLCGWDCAERRV